MLMPQVFFKSFSWVKGTCRSPEKGQIPVQHLKIIQTHVSGLHRMTAIPQKDPLHWFLVSKFGLIPLVKLQVMKYRKHGQCVTAETIHDYSGNCHDSLRTVERIRKNMLRKHGSRKKTANNYELKKEIKSLLWYLNKEHCWSLKNISSLTENLKC